MTATQKKVLSIILMVIGVIFVLIGIAGVIQVNDVNSQMEQMNQMTGGMLGGMAKSMGQPVEASYVGSIIYLVLGFASSIVGFKMLGKVAA
jgi:multisubunit Na+/H+ antiporter MnhG subunit